MIRPLLPWVVTGLLAVACADKGANAISEPVKQLDAGQRPVKASGKKRRKPPRKKPDAGHVIHVAVLPVPPRQTQRDAGTHPPPSQPSEDDDVVPVEVPDASAPEDDATPEPSPQVVLEAGVPPFIGWLGDAGDAGPSDAGRDAAVPTEAGANDSDVSPADASVTPIDSGSYVEPSDAGSSDLDPSDSGGAPKDAAVPPVGPGFDAGQTCIAECAAVGARCVDQACVFDCSAPGACAGPVLCPEGRPCSVQCGLGSCTGPVECPDKSTCVVACDGDDSCTGGVTCRGNDCNVGCHGARSCQGDIGGGATLIRLVCDGEESCGAVQCDAQTCDLDCTASDTCDSLSVNANVLDATCSGANSCDEVNCSAGQCLVRCPGAGSCDNVNCSANIVTPACR